MSTLRRYSLLTRVVAGIFALVVFTPATFLFIWFLVSDAEMRTWDIWSAALGGLGGIVILAKIAITGTSTRFLEQPASKALGIQPDSFIEPPTPEGDHK